MISKCARHETLVVCTYWYNWSDLLEILEPYVQYTLLKTARLRSSSYSHHLLYHARRSSVYLIREEHKSPRAILDGLTSKFSL